MQSDLVPKSGKKEEKQYPWIKQGQLFVCVCVCVPVLAHTCTKHGFCCLVVLI